MSDLPWTQEELPTVEDSSPRFTRLDLAGPHKRIAQGFKTQPAAESYIERNDLSPQPPDGWTGQPIPVLLVEHRVGVGWCIFEFPRFQLSKAPF